MADDLTHSQHVRRIVEALEKITIDEYGVCRACRFDSLGHASDCYLAAALSSARELLSRLEGDAVEGWRTMESAPLHEPILTKMKHGVIEGVWDGQNCEGYYWQTITWYPSHWMPLPSSSWPRFFRWRAADRWLR